MGEENLRLRDKYDFRGQRLESPAQVDTNHPPTRQITTKASPVTAGSVLSQSKCKYCNVCCTLLV